MNRTVPTVAASEQYDILSRMRKPQCGSPTGPLRLRLHLETSRSVRKLEKRRWRHEVDRTRTRTLGRVETARGWSIDSLGDTIGCIPEIRRGSTCWMPRHVDEDNLPLLLPKLDENFNVRKSTRLVVGWRSR